MAAPDALRNGSSGTLCRGPAMGRAARSGHHRRFGSLVLAACP